jgi:tripartite-type tricarboxylate transporter receptor subunit TctC
MKNLRELVCTAIVVLFAVAGAAAPAGAQESKGQPARLFVPFAAGGSSDLVARQMARNLSDIWGMPVIVENRPGAAGTVASRALVQAPPDGRTLLIVASGHAINELIYDKLPYRTIGDFTPIAQVADIPNVLIVPRASPYRTAAEAVAAARAKPDGLSYGTAGAGTSVHLAGEMLKAMTGAHLEAVHFKGDSASLTALVGEHIPLSFNTVPGAKAQIEAGAVRALGVTSGVRSSSLPDVPTIGEAAVKGYEVSNWFGILGPAGMDPRLVAKLNADIRKSLSDAATVGKFGELGIMLKVSTPQEFDALIRSDIDKWRPVIEKLGLRGATN